VRARHEGGATSELRIQGESAFAMNILNRQVRLASRPQGIPQAEHFAIGEKPVPPLLDGQVLVRNAFLSVDPAMRGWVNAAANYAEPVAIGAVMRSFAVGEVVRSRHPAHAEGDLVFGLLGWQEWAVVDGGPSGPIERKVNDIPASGLPLSAALGVLGLNGATAYFGLLDVGMPRAGEVVAVSSAAGAVGSCVGQIAKIVGCRTIGIVGGQAKADLCRTEFGFDAAVVYRAADFEEALAAASPDGIDVYFDNTSGAISDAVMRRINTRGRVVICGTAAVADWDPPPLGPRVERKLLVSRARMQGFIAPDYQDRWGEAFAQLGEWIRDGRLRHREHVLEGIEQAPGAIAMLYRGENMGKLVIRLTPQP
jgi:NADPH-dependent curcumin reductase CurA